MSLKIQLSVVVITFNEERNIARCLDSVASIADDIVVVDSFSADKTEQLCKERNVRFVQHTFEGHIEQKNWAITQAKYPYILSLDADEALDDTLKSAIQKVKNNWLYDGYTMNRLTNYCGKWIKHCGWYPDKKLRLWDSRKGKWTGSNPHDRYELNREAKQMHLAGNILHYSYYTIADHDKQIEFFSTIGAKAYFKKGKTSTFFYRFFSPVVKFLKCYVFNLGILDGYYGFLISSKSAYATYLKYKKLQRIQLGESI